MDDSIPVQPTTPPLSIAPQNEFDYTLFYHNLQQHINITRDQIASTIYKPSFKGIFFRYSYLLPSPNEEPSVSTGAVPPPPPKRQRRTKKQMLADSQTDSVVTLKPSAKKPPRKRAVAAAATTTTQGTPKVTKKKATRGSAVVATPPKDEPKKRKRATTTANAKTKKKQPTAAEQDVKAATPKKVTKPRAKPTEQSGRAPRTKTTKKAIIEIDAQQDSTSSSPVLDGNTSEQKPNIIKNLILGQKETTSKRSTTTSSQRGPRKASTTTPIVLIDSIGDSDSDIQAIAISHHPQSTRPRSSRLRGVAATAIPPDIEEVDEMSDYSDSDYNDDASPVKKPKPRGKAARKNPKATADTTAPEADIGTKPTTKNSRQTPTKATTTRKRSAANPPASTAKRTRTTRQRNTVGGSDATIVVDLVDE